MMKPTLRTLVVVPYGVFLLSACGAAPLPPAPVDPTPLPVAEPTVVVTPPAKPAVDPRVAAHEAKVAAALARVPKIAERVSQIRKLPLKHPVPASIQGQEDFKTFLAKEIAKDLPAAKSANSVKALVRLGFLKESINLAQTVEDAMLSQAGAYYDPETKRFYIVLVPDDEMMLDVMSAHELTHALDDQYFDLAAYTEGPTHALSNDVGLARKMVAEGEATLVMLAFQAAATAHMDIFDPKNRPIAQGMVAGFAELDSEALAKSAADSPDMLKEMGPSVKASIDAMSTIPPLILDPLFGAYTKGASAVSTVQQAGGWDAVSKLYTDPPESTEQLLHPMQKYVTKRDHPVELTFAPAPKMFAGLTPIDEDVIGEMTMAVYFRLWGKGLPAKPSSQVTGWGGDRYVAYDVGGRTVTVWLTTWDTVEDATRFAKAYDATLAVRFPGENHVVNAGSNKLRATVVHKDVTMLTVAQNGKDVAIIDGAESKESLALLDWPAKATHTQAGSRH